MQAECSPQAGGSASSSSSLDPAACQPAGRRSPHLRCGRPRRRPQVQPRPVGRRHHDAAPHKAGRARAEAEAGAVPAAAVPAAAIAAAAVAPRRAKRAVGGAAEGRRGCRCCGVGAEAGAVGGLRGGRGGRGRADAGCARGDAGRGSLRACVRLQQLHANPAPPSAFRLPSNIGAAPPSPQPPHPPAPTSSWAPPACRRWGPAAAPRSPPRPPAASAAPRPPPPVARQGVGRS